VPEDKPRLFNLKTDLGEANDLALHTLKWPPSFLPSPAAWKTTWGSMAPAPGSRALGRVETPHPIIEHDGKVRADLGLAQRKSG